MWWYALVGLAAVLAVLWIASVIVGLLLGLVKLAIVVILAVAAITWVVQSKAER